MNIIHVFPVIRTGGGTTLLQNNLVNLYKKTTNEIWTDRVDEDIKFYRVKPQITKHTNLKNFFKVFIKLLKKNRKSCLLHIHGRSGLLVFIAAKIQNYKIIYQAHGYYGKLTKNKNFNFIQNLIDIFLLRFSDLVIFCSESEKDFIVKLYNLKNKNRVIQNNVNNIKKGNRKIKNTEKINLIYCLATSNIYQKGIDLQLKLVKELLDLYTDFKIIHFFNYQNLKEKEIINKSIRELGLSNHYYLKPTIENVWDYVDPIRGTIISTSRFEGQPLVISEAFYNNIPVVATNCLGQKDLLNDQNAFILDIKNKKDWPNILLKAISLQKQRNKKSEFAKKWLSQFGDKNTYTEKLLESYLSVMGLKK